VTSLSFSAFESSVRNLSASELSKLNAILGLKTAVAGKLLSEKFKENEQHASDLGREVHDLKQDLERVQSSSRDLAAQVKELTEALKSSQNEKKLVDAAHHNLKKEHDKLKEAQSNDVQILEELRKSVDEGTAAITQLRGTNANLLKQNSNLVGQVSVRDTRILELEKMVDERDDTLNRGAEGIKRHFRLLFEKYGEALGQFGARAQPFPRILWCRGSDGMDAIGIRGSS
jgi:chromosome segregation ATPase